MICAISGEVPEEPVISKKSGLLFERRLIEHHIASHGKCPVTKEDLTTDDLVPVKTNKVVKPRPLQAASIPGLLGMFQNEWDALMLSNFALEQQLHTARQELSHALYQAIEPDYCLVRLNSSLSGSIELTKLCNVTKSVHTNTLHPPRATPSHKPDFVRSCCLLCRRLLCRCLHHRRIGPMLPLLSTNEFEGLAYCALPSTVLPPFTMSSSTASAFTAITVGRFFHPYCCCLRLPLLLLLLPSAASSVAITVIRKFLRHCCPLFPYILSSVTLFFSLITVNSRLNTINSRLLTLLSFVLYIVLSPCWSDHFFSTNCIILQHDAACRVIARLKKERDEARVLLAQAERQIPLLTASAANATTVVSNGKRAAEDELGPDGKRIRPGINPAIIAELTECNALLSGQRKKRQIPATLASVDALERSTQISSHPLHKTNKPGILSIDIDASKDMIATGGLDTNGVLFNRTSGQILSTLAGHSKKVTSVKFVPGSEVIVTGSSDKTVRVWQGTEDGNYDCGHVLRDHTAEVQAVTVHATQKYFVTASMDNTWCFYDLSTGSCLTQVGEASTEEGFTSASFHPDGLILGTGTTGAIVKIWDVKSQSNVAKFDGHVGSVTAMSFSENGYFLATAAVDGVKLWDLRKLRNFRSFAPYDPNTPTNSVEFDFSGSYLAIAGSDTRVYQVANVKVEWNLIKTFPDLSGTGKVTCVKFGADAKYMAVGSMDRNLRIFGLPGDDSEELRSPDH
ncbi:unnamed protein product [Musa textilis]